MLLVTMETHMYTVYLSREFPYSFEATFLYWSFLVDGEFACLQKLLSYLLGLFRFQSIYMHMCIQKIHVDTH